MMIIRIMILSLAVFTVLGSVIMGIRNEIVFKARMRALDVLRHVGDEYMARKEYEKAIAAIGCLNSFPTYNAMMWDLSAWRFRDFFPDLAGGE